MNQTVALRAFMAGAAIADLSVLAGGDVEAAIRAELIRMGRADQTVVHPEPWRPGDGAELLTEEARTRLATPEMVNAVTEEVKRAMRPRPPAPVTVLPPVSGRIEEGAVDLEAYPVALRDPRSVTSRIVWAALGDRELELSELVEATRDQIEAGDIDRTISQVLYRMRDKGLVAPNDDFPRKWSRV